jgi:hypothetical protein
MAKTTKTKAPKGAKLETVGDILTGSLAHDPSTNAPSDKLEQWAERLDMLQMEAENWADGTPLENQDQADTLTKLIAMIEATSKELELDRESETKPLYALWKNAVAEWKPAQERLEKLLKVCKRTLTPWLKKVQDEQRAEAERLRREAEEAAALAREQATAARTEGGSFADEEVIEELIDDAKARERDAREAAKARPVARGGGRNIGLRKVWLVNVVEPRELLQHYLKTREDFREDLRKLLHATAQKDVRAQNGARSLPGCRIWDEEVAA